MSPLTHTNLGLINFLRVINFGNIVQLLLLSVAMINCLAVLFYMHTVYIYIYLYLYVLCCMCMSIAISLDRWNVKIKIPVQFQLKYLSQFINQ